MPFALITGASKGIGKAISGNLAERGYNLLLIARSEELLQAAAAEFTTAFRIKCYYLALDLATDQAADRVYAWCAENQFPITVLVN
ncbi:MAG TPA: SDR family NAD(P)-dependent oxidoreductase, partial [Puia sp.]|nr:SDR family NAD(P)-dependent oxidoreductase [Puia sp.]